MKPNTHELSALFLDVRKSYRLLHDYQRMVMDAVKYIGDQLGLQYAGGWPKFTKGQPRAGGGYLKNWSWDWLSMVLYEFHFTQDSRNNSRIPEGQDIRLSIVIVSDTGYFESDSETAQQPDLASYAPADRSGTKLAFVLSDQPWEGLDFFRNKKEMKRFLDTDGELPPKLKEQGAVGKCCDAALLMDEESTDALIGQLITLAGSDNIPLCRAQDFSRESEGSPSP